MADRRLITFLALDGRVVGERQRRVVGVLGERALHVHGIDGAVIIVDPFGIAGGIGWLFRRQMLTAFFVYRAAHRSQRRSDCVQISALHWRKMRLLGVAAFRNTVLLQAEGKCQRQISLLVLADDVFNTSELGAAD